MSATLTVLIKSNVLPTTTTTTILQEGAMSEHPVYHCKISLSCWFLVMHIGRTVWTIVTTYISFLQGYTFWGVTTYVHD